LSYKNQFVTVTKFEPAILKIYRLKAIFSIVLKWNLKHGILKTLPCRKNFEFFLWGRSLFRDSKTLSIANFRSV